ncbi:MAG: hypothetical protein E7670_06035 [Ruminococcaceae bacterium]|nr:hypothetical protein [Oscillospiraceae bacterium]
MWIFLLIAVIAAVVLYPYISVAVCRYRAISNLRSKLRRVGGRMRVLRRFAFASSNRSAKYDLLVEKDSILYAVKFWSCTHKNTTLRIYSDGRVCEERMLGAPITPKGERKERAISYRAKYVPKTEYNFKNLNDKKIINVILVYPSYKNIILDKGGEERVLHSGDLFFDKVILTPLAFGRILSQKTED